MSIVVKINLAPVLVAGFDKYVYLRNESTKTWVIEQDGRMVARGMYGEANNDAILLAQLPEGNVYWFPQHRVFIYHRGEDGLMTHYADSDPQGMQEMIQDILTHRQEVSRAYADKLETAIFSQRMRQKRLDDLPDTYGNW